MRAEALNRKVRYEIPRRTLRKATGLVFQRDYGAAVAAEGGDSLQAAVRAGDGHDGSVAIDGVTGGGKIPASTLGAVSYTHLTLPTIYSV